MNHKTSSFLTLIAAITVGGAALAESGYASGHHELPDRGNNMHLEGEMLGHFEHLDKNDDSKVSREEMAAHEDTVRKFNKVFEERTRQDR